MTAGAAAISSDMRVLQRPVCRAHHVVGPDLRLVGLEEAGK
jgi:hypothetical protein